MNVLDVLLLANLRLLCHFSIILSRLSNSAQLYVHIQWDTFVAFCWLIMIRALQKVIKTHAVKVYTQKFKQLPLFSTTEQGRPIVEPTVAEISYAWCHTITQYIFTKLTESDRLANLMSLAIKLTVTLIENNIMSTCLCNNETIHFMEFNMLL